ncbi:MAG: PKD domain-containing protein, partial [Flavobacteriales bacterium]|nr:PKD domain-containing protein [Flavobacteriales bacterium]
NFCINSTTQTIEIFDLPDFTLDPTDVACYGEATGSIEVVDAGIPVDPWTLTLNNGTPQVNDLNFNGLETGNYEVVVVDDNGCGFSQSTIVGQPDDTLGIQLNNIDDILCNGETTGEINIQGAGGTGPYTYQVDAGGLSANGLFTGLEAGDHAVQVVDANSCVFDTTITLTEPDTLVLTFVDAMDLLCNSDNSGWLTVLGTGGVSPYEYNIDGGGYDLSDTFNGLAADTYIVGVRDANGCTDTLHVTLTEPGILQLSLVASDSAVCFNAANGSIEVAAASGTEPYQYSLDGISFQGAGLFEGLFAGSYTITVMDANGCLDDLTEEIFEPTELTIETSSVPVACFGDMTGEIVITATGGIPDYNYSIDGGGSFVQNGGIFLDVESNNYLVVVEDASGCSASEGVVISEPSSAFNLSADITDVACMGDASGSVLLIGSGGTPTYRYSDNNSTFVTPNTFDGFSVGDYVLYGQDLNGCTDSVEVAIGEPNTVVGISGTITSNPACPNEATGTITVLATNGTPGYTYSSDGGNTFQTNPILTGLGNGNHLIVVMDANGCTVSEAVGLTAPPIFELILDSVIGVDCENDFDGEIHIIAAGGTPSYNYQIDGGNFQSNGDFIGLTFGTYQMNIMDVNGCSFSQTIELPTVVMQAVPDFSFIVVAEAVLFTNESQFGDSYLWDFGDGNTSTDESPTHVYDVPGNYTVTLTVTNNCGSESISVFVSIIFTAIADSEELSFGLYPNPATNEIFIEANRTIENDLTIEVISTTGQLISTMNKANLDASGRLRIDLSGIATGIYYLRVVSEKEQSVLRFDIIK